MITFSVCSWGLHIDGALWASTSNMLTCCLSSAVYPTLEARTYRVQPYCSVPCLLTLSQDEVRQSLVGEHVSVPTHCPLLLHSALQMQAGTGATRSSFYMRVCCTFIYLNTASALQHRNMQYKQPQNAFAGLGVVELS